VIELESRMSTYLKDCDQAHLKANALQEEVCLLRKENARLQVKV